MIPTPTIESWENCECGNADGPTNVPVDFGTTEPEGLSLPRLKLQLTSISAQVI